jgi:hypothetical protein
MDPLVQQASLYALTCISDVSTKGAAAVADARGGLIWAFRLLVSPIARVSLSACEILKNLARLNELVVYSAAEALLLFLIEYLFYFSAAFMGVLNSLLQAPRFRCRNKCVV